MYSDDKHKNPLQHGGSRGHWSYIFPAGTWSESNDYAAHDAEDGECQGTLQCLEGVRRILKAIVRVEPAQPQLSVGASTVNMVRFTAVIADGSSVSCIHTGLPV